MSEVFALSPSDSRGQFIGDLTAQTPQTHGYLRIEMTIADDHVVTAKPLLGSMHRGAEKLFESRDYRQILMLANRHEWLGAFAGEVGIAELLEKALGIETTDQVRNLRDFLLNFNRVTSHLAFLAGLPLPNLQNSVAIANERELLVQHLEAFTGSRMHPMITRIGGFASIPEEAWVRTSARLAQELLTRLDTLLEDAALSAFANIGRLTKEQAIEFSVSGPVARASGHQIDLREDTSTIANPAGDARARIEQLLQEVQDSLTKIIQTTGTVIESLGENFEVILPKVVRLPEGTYLHQIETPLGIASWLLESRGDKYPHRLKLRPASLHTVLALSVVLPGTHRADISKVVASLPFVAGDFER